MQFSDWKIENPEVHRILIRPIKSPAKVSLLEKCPAQTFLILQKAQVVNFKPKIGFRTSPSIIYLSSPTLPPGVQQQHHKRKGFERCMIPTISRLWWNSESLHACLVCYMEFFWSKNKNGRIKIPRNGNFDRGKMFQN